MKTIISLFSLMSLFIGISVQAVPNVAEVQALGDGKLTLPASNISAAKPANEGSANVSPRAEARSSVVDPTVLARTPNSGTVKNP